MGYADVTHPELQEFLDREEQNQKANTYENRRTGLRAFQTWLNETGRDLDRLTGFDIEDLAAWLTNGGPNVSDRTAYLYIQQVDAFHKYRQRKESAETDGGKSADPESLLEHADLKNLDHSESVREQHLHQTGGVALSPAEMEQMIDHAPDPRFRNQLVMRCLGGLGCRPRDLRDLRVSNVDFEDGVNGAVYIRSTKTTNSRKVPLSPQLRTNLKLWLDGGYRESQCFYARSTDYLIPGEYSERLGARTVTNNVHEAAEEAGLQELVREGDDDTQPLWKITPYAFRKGFATHMKSKVDPKTLQYLMGHKRIETTLKHCTAVTDDDLDHAASQVPDL